MFQETAVTSFKGDADNHEIDFAEGDVAVSIRHCNDARWCYAKNGRTGESGIVPCSLFDTSGSRRRFTGEEMPKHLAATVSSDDEASDGDHGSPDAKRGGGRCRPVVAARGVRRRRRQV